MLAAFAPTEKISKNLIPYITVEILGNEFPAFLDGGSGSSVVGDEIIKLIKEKQIKVSQCNRQLKLLTGCAYAEESVSLTIKYFHGSRRQSCYMVPSAPRPLILGRDFLAPEDISILYGRGGYLIGTDWSTQQPFVPYNDIEYRRVQNRNLVEVPSTSASASAPIIEEMDSDDEFEMNIMFWTQMVESEEIDMGKEKELEDNLESLFQDECEFLMVPIELEEAKKETLRNALRPFLDMFSEIPGDCKLYEHRIEIDPPYHRPLKAKMQIMSKGKREIFDKTFFELLRYGIIRPSKSPWSSCAFVLPKKDGTWRFIVDYRELNKITIPDNYPMPNIEEILAYLGGSNWISVFDLAKGFYQMSMAKEHIERTAFICHHGLFEFTRLPMGLRNSPASFQRCMDFVLRETRWNTNIPYMDDIVTYSPDFEKHVEDIIDTLTKLRNANYTVHPRKVQLCRRRLKYLGYIITPGKCYPNPEKVENIKKFPRPENAADIAQFFGLLGYYRKFIPDFAIHAKPIYNLTGEKSWVWNEECEKSFHHLKYALCGQVELYLPDLNLEFIITCDASRKGLAAILAQEKDGIRYPIWFASRTLRPAETRYSVSEIELLSILFGVEKFRPYIELTHFVVETDHSALQWLQKIKDPVGRLARWFMILQGFNFTVRHKSGTSACIRPADSLSRSVIKEDDNMVLASFDDSIHRNRIIAEQDFDPFLSDIKRYLRLENLSGIFPRDRIAIHASRAYIGEDGLLWRYIGPKDKLWEDENMFFRVWIPMSLKNQIISLFHDNITAGHLGRNKTYHKLEDRVFWTGMAKDVGTYIKNCEACVRAKPILYPPAPNSSYVAEAPWEVISVDLAGPYCKSSKQSTVLFILLDVFSKWVSIFPLRKAKAEYVINCMKEVFFIFGVPRVVISDNGSQFVSNIYMEFCKLNGINPFHQSPYHAKSNPTERYVGTIKSLIRATISKAKDWDKYIKEIAFALNSSVSETTGFTPAYLNFGRELRLPFDNMCGMPVPRCNEIAKIRDRIMIVHDLARNEIANSQDKSLEYKNRGTKERSFEVGDKVWMRTHILSDKSKGISSGLAPRREGPYLVTNRVSTHVYDLKCTDTSQLVNKIHVNDLTPYHGSNQ